MRDSDGGGIHGFDATPTCTAGDRVCDGDELRVCSGSPPDWSTRSCPLGCAASEEPRCRRVLPRNVPPSILDDASGGLMVPGGAIIDTDARTITAPGGDLVGAPCAVVAQGEGLPELCVFAAARIDVRGGAVNAYGNRALVLAGTEEIVIGGVLSADGDITRPGPGGWSGGRAEDAPGAGPAGGEGGATEADHLDHAGGGGGGHGGRGGDGGRGAEANPGLPAIPLGGSAVACGDAADPTWLEPLCGGSGGGAGQMGSRGGSGGGGVQLVSSGVVRVLGGIDVGGSGGRRGAALNSPGGGGAGGAILIQAARVELAAGAFLAANGGGGGGPGALADGDGEEATTDDRRAHGGAAADGMGPGGSGGAGHDADGRTGESMGHAGGGGGGAAGRIRIETPSGGLAIDSAARVSPALGSVSVTTGDVATR